MKSMWQVLARFARIQPKIDAQERSMIAERNYAAGFAAAVAIDTGKPTQMSWHDYASHIAGSQQSGAMARLLAPRPAELVQPQSAVYERPEMHTEPIKPVVNPELAKWGVNTASLPAYPGAWTRLRKQNGALRKQQSG